MYKLGLVQYGKAWKWYLQQVVPADMPLSPERSKYAGTAPTVREAIKAAHEWVPNNEVSYIFLDRHDGVTEPTVA